MTAGYFQSNYFPDLFWQDDYWNEYGTALIMPIYVISLVLSEANNIKLFLNETNITNIKVVG